MKNYVEQIAEAPAAIAQALRATMTAYTQKQHAAQSAFDQAIKAADECVGENEMDMLVTRTLEIIDALPR